MSITGDIHRIAVKLPLADPGALDLEDLIPVFHAWIRDGKVLDGLLIDVADYRHVPDGPGVMLIGHEWDRSVDLGRDTGPGVQSVAKRDLTGTLVERIRAVADDARRAAAALDRSLDGGAEIRPGRIELTFLDRLNAPNTRATYAAALPAITEALDATGEPVQVGDERRPFRVVVPV